MGVLVVSVYACLDMCVCVCVCGLRKLCQHGFWFVAALVPPCTCGFSAKNFLSNENTNCCQVEMAQGQEKVNNAFGREGGGKEGLSSAAGA